MQKRKLGNSGLEVSAIGMGCMNLSFGTGKAADINDGVKVIRAEYEKGLWHESANASSGANNESFRKATRKRYFPHRGKTRK